MRLRLLNLALCRSDATVPSKANQLAARDLVANPIGLLWRSRFHLLYRDGHRISDVEHESESETWATPSQTKSLQRNIRRSIPNDLEDGWITCKEVEAS